jgi:hypothetical protein
MVPPEDVDVIGVSYFQSEEEADCLNTLSAPVDVVSQEKVGGIGREPTVLEKSEHIVVLSVDISTDFDWCFYLNEHRLFHEDFLDETNEAEDFLLLELDHFAGFAAAYCEESLDDAVDFDVNFVGHCYVIDGLGY